MSEQRKLIMFRRHLHSQPVTSPIFAICER